MLVISIRPEAELIHRRQIPPQPTAITGEPEGTITVLVAEGIAPLIAKGCCDTTGCGWADDEVTFGRHTLKVVVYEVVDVISNEINILKFF